MRLLRSLPLSLGLLAALTLPAQAGLSPTELSPTEIVRKADAQRYGDSSYTETSMRIVRPGWTRTMEMKSWSKGEDLSLVLITAPAKSEGNASLKRYKEMWSWLPGIERVLKITPSMMGQSWMGSDFTNQDMVNPNSIVVDYSHEMVGEEVYDGSEAWVIDAIAKEDSPVVWSKVRLWIDKADFLQRKSESYDEFGDLMMTLNTYDVRELGGRRVMTRMEMIPHDKPGHKTEMVTRQAQFDFAIGDDFFSQSQMKNLRK